MILISVGSTLFPFQRMTTLVEHLAHVRPKNERIIFQYGHTQPHFLDRHVEPHAFIPHARLMRYMVNARIIICHGGPGTIYQALSFGKIPWVLPRQKRFGEHLNNHQVDFAKFMARHKLIHCITPKTSITRICMTDKSIPPIRKTNRQLSAFLDALLREYSDKR